jgi:uncharacterized protein YwqG
MPLLDPLANAAHALGLDHLLPLLETHSLPAIHFDLTPVGDSQPLIGQSRFGGDPDLPNNFEWPEWHDRELSFLAQVNLADVTRYAPPDMLPSIGILGFFYDLVEQPWGYDPRQLGGFRVTYTPATMPLHRSAQLDGTESLRPCLMTFTPCLTLPHPGSWGYDQLELQAHLSNEDTERYWDLLDRLPHLYSHVEQPSQHQLLGHSANVQGDMQLEAQLVSHGIYCGDPSGYQSPHALQLAAGAQEWKLLLQLDTDKQANVMWGDAGMLYFWIRQSDCQQYRFDRVWMTMQCH